MTAYGTFRLDGADKLLKTLTEIGRAGYAEAAGALWEEGETIMTESRKVVPRDTGALASSARVTVLQDGRPKFASGADIVGRVSRGKNAGNVKTQTFMVGRVLPTTTRTDVVLSFGGPAAPYALYVHEAPDSWQWNARGTGPKYLQRPFRKAMAGMGGRLARKIKRRVEHVAR